MTDYHEVRDSLMHSNGTTAMDTYLSVIPSFFTTFIITTVTSVLMSYISFNNRKRFIFEFSILVVPLILYMTILSNYIIPVLLYLAIISIILSLLIYFSSRAQKKIIVDRNRNDFVTNARAIINILSVIAILAVDFSVFPRSSTKTIAFGYSLMDLGVGLYVFSNGIVAPDIAVKSSGDAIRKCVASSLPLLILGIMRAIFVKEINYHVPIAEYGVHWNFFLTLGVTKIFSTLILGTVRLKYLYINALLLLISHEVLLQAGLADLVMKNTKRNSLFLANKEGLVSCLGYISLYLMSVYCGHILNLKNNFIRRHMKLRIFVRFSVICILSLTISLVLKRYFGISRRLANSAYCLWILFLGIFMTCLFYLGELFQRYILGEKLIHSIFTPFIFEAVNYNGLAFFLLSNLMTGLINVMCDTLKMNSIISIAIISTYMFINCGAMCFLFVKGKSLKYR